MVLWNQIFDSSENHEDTVIIQADELIRGFGTLGVCEAKKAMLALDQEVVGANGENLARA